MKRYRIIYEGIVQGVGFRWTLLNIAYRLNITGYAKNLDNGNVEVEIQGSNEAIDEFIKKSLKKDTFIQIYNYVLKEINTIDNEEIFDIRF